MPPPLSLVEAFALVPDPRDPRGRHHPLVAVLGLAAVAMLAGCETLHAISQFGRDHGLPLAHALGFRRAKTPAASTLRDPFAALDPAALDAALRAWLASRGADTGHLALDGKTARGSGGHAPAAHLLAAYATDHAAVVGQLRVAATTNEHKAALRLLGVLPLAGRVVTADAMFTHRDVCDAITDAGGDYLLAVEDNRELLADDLDAMFADRADLSPPPAEPARGRGRLGVLVG
jgi:hypothetical protein